ncbi:MAG: NYN domain-containing protein [Lachnospiraceae bacterium]|nr:NYN domain-containing protein [Lachnospiraceae bacterium]
MEEKTQFAVLIDADNISAKYAPVIFDELEKYGYASCRRIYGNWSKGTGWKEEILLEHSIIPIQQFSYTLGKNSTDMAMVIDAMDLLYQNKVDGFCLVTSDSDFTRLAMRLREENKYIIGMGESKTPPALTRACNRFIHLNLIGESDKDSIESDTISNLDGDSSEYVTSIKDLEKAILGIINESGKGKVDLGAIGNRLSKRYPDFDVRNYGYSKLSVFINEEMPGFYISKENKHNFVQKGELIEREEIKKEVISMIEGNNGVIDNLSIINNKLKDEHEGFDLHDYGYSRFSSFLRSIEGLLVDGNRVRLKRKK